MKASILNAVRQSFLHIPQTDSRSKITPQEFVVTLVTAMINDSPKRSLANLRRQMASSLGVFIARSSFWERLSTNRLRNHLILTIRKLVDKMSNQLSLGTEILVALNVSAVYLLDSSSITVPKGAKSAFPAPRNNVIPAAIKWHLCWNLFSGVSEWFCISDACTHDRKGFPPFEMLRGALIMFDLGYWDYQLLIDLANHGCFYLSRIKAKAKIKIIAIPSRAGWTTPLGKNLFSLKWGKYRGDVIEMLGEIALNDSDSLELRVFGFWNKATKSYHWYVSNLPIRAVLIYPLYRLRWQIELVFKAGKSSMSLADLTSANTDIIINLTLAAITTSLIAQPISKAVLADATSEIQMAASVQRAGLVFVHLAEELAKFLLSGTTNTKNLLKSKLLLYIEELVDPNFRHRPTSLQRLGLLL